jgi:hypothetical protein
MTARSDSLSEDIEALRLVEQAGLDSTLEFVAQTLVTSWLYIRRHLAKTGKSFDQLTAADLIEEIRKAQGEKFPPISVMPKT